MKYRWSQRLLSLGLVVALMFSMATTAFANPYYPDDNPLADWKETSKAAGKQMLVFDQFRSTFMSDISTAYNAIMNGVTDTLGRTYYGLNNSQPSDRMVAQYLGYFLADCLWADYNMLYKEDGKQKYNLFYATATGYNNENDYPDVTRQLATIADEISKIYTDTTNPWTGEFSGALADVLEGNGYTVTGVFKDAPATLEPGKGNYQNALYSLMVYFYTQMAGILAAEYLTEDEITAALSTSGGALDAGKILTAISDKIETGTIFSGTTTTPTEGEGTEGGEGTPEATPGTETGGETAVPPAGAGETDTYKWPENFSTSTSLIIGDSAAIKLAASQGWIADGSVTQVTDNATSDHPAILAVDLKSDYAGSSMGVSDTIFSTEIAGLAHNIDDSFIGNDAGKGVTDIYIIFGGDKAYADENIGSLLDNTDEEKFSSSMLVEMWQALGRIASFSEDSHHVTILTPPLLNPADFSEDEAANVTLANQKLTHWNSELPTTLSESTYDVSFGTVYYRPLVVDGAETNMKDYWENFEQAHVTDAPPDDNETSAPVGETENGYNATVIYNLYKANEEKLAPWFESYTAVRNHIDALWSTGFADNVDFIAYYREHSTSVYYLPPLCEDLYEQGYQQSDKYKNPQPTLNPGDQKPDEERYDRIIDPIELISNAKMVNNEIVIPDLTLDDAQLTIEGYIALAAGVVYDPFVSIAGNEAYFSTVRYMLDTVEEDSITKIERLLHEAYTRKKPLYVIDGDKSAWKSIDDLGTAPSGDYRYARLSDVLQSTDNQTRVYTVIAGGMEPSSVDASTWEYTFGGQSSSSGADTSTATTGTEKTDNGVSIRGNSQKSTTVAGSTLVASPSNMSGPVMFTSGAKTGAWFGNWDGSASGYAASLGGLTTMIIHNAAQDAKDNPAVKAPEDYLLFMNGLGDIVLDDGTIVLPAIANPAIYNYDAISYSVDSSSSGESFGVGLALGIVGAVGSAVLTGGASLVVILGVSAAGGVAGTAGGAVLGNIADTWGEGDSHESMLEVYDKTQAYYPYTAAFMNHYPSVIINTAGNLAVTNTNDTGKFVIGIDDTGNILARAITGLNNKTQVNLEYSGGGITIAPIQGLSFDVTDNSRKVGTALPYISGKDGTTATRFNTARKFEYFMVKDTIYSGDDQAFFPLNDGLADLKDSYLKLSGALVTSAERFLMERVASGDVTKAHETFNVKRYVVDMAGQGLMGTQYSETLQKNYQISYDEIVEDTGNRLLTFFVQLVESAVETLGSVDGVLAIKNGYENRFFNMIVQFIQEFYLLIAVVLLVIVAVKFMKGHYNFIFVVFIAGLCFCGFEVYANWMPTVVPSIYNFAVNDAVEQIAWNTVTVSAENYAETYLDSNRKDATTGALKPYTATLTLYKMSQTDMETIAESIGATVKSIKSGDIYYLDETAGIFVQGDSIKISVDKLLTNNTMRGLYFTQWEELAAGITDSEDFITPVTDDADKISNPYSIQLTQPYVSLEAYYMPYNEIERAFLVNLNSFASVFRFERNQFSYSKNLYKDAFLFNCYTNSGIFTSPGVKDVLRENIKVGSVLGGYDYGTDDDNVEMLLKRIYGGEGMEALFKYPTDWLNVAAVFRSPSANMKDSLWGRMMQRQGWYDENWDIKDPEALGDLVAYINEQTRQFVINNSDQLNFCSDENAIKLTSLYATTCFTHYVSQFGSWLYPNYLNAADIELKDVLYGSMTTLRDRNTASESSVVATVAYKLGVFGVIFLLLITLFATVFVFTVTYLVPILYALLGVIIIYKLINDQNSLGLVQGYLKVTGVTCLLYFIFSLSLRLVEVGGYAWYGYLGCALLMYLCCYFLFWVCISVIQNIGEMGNEVLGQNLLRGLDHITRGAVRKLSTNILNARRGFQGYGRPGYGYGRGYGSPYSYGRGAGIDDRDYIRGSRSQFGLGRGRRYDDYGYGGYGRGDSYDYGMYEREGRMGRRGLVGGLMDRVTSSGRRGRQATAMHSTGERTGMGRYAQSQTTVHIRQEDMARLDDSGRR